MEKYLFTIGEVSELLGESTSCIRFWSDSFPKDIQPKRNAKGNRLYTKDDIEKFKHIQLLLKVEGLTIEGAAKRLRGDKKDAVMGEIQSMISVGIADPDQIQESMKIAPNILRTIEKQWQKNLNGKAFKPTLRVRL